MLTKKTRGCIFRLLPLLLLAILATGCGVSYPEISIKPPNDLDTITVPTPQYRPDVNVPLDSEIPFIRLALAPVFIQPQTQVYYRNLPAYLAENLNQPVDLVFRLTYAEVDQMIKQGLVDIALIGNQSYVELKATEDVELLVIPQIKGQTRHHSYIIVPAGSSNYHFEDLRDGKFIFTDPLSFSGKLYVLHLLDRIGETSDTFFSDHIYSYSHDSSVIAVAEGWVEAAAVDSLVYDSLIEENPELAEKIRIISVSPSVSNSPVVVNSGVPEALRQNLKEIFLMMHESEAGQKALAEIRVERFVAGEDEDYNTIREILENEGGAS